MTNRLLMKRFKIDFIFFYLPGDVEFAQHILPPYLYVTWPEEGAENETVITKSIS